MEPSEYDESHISAAFFYRAKPSAVTSTIGLAAFPALAGALVEWVGVGSVGSYLFAMAVGMEQAAGG